MIRPSKHPKSGVYRLRKAVPVDLQPLVGQKALIRTLNTKDPGKAKRRAPAVVAEFEAILERARRAQQCSADDLRGLAGEYYRERYEALLQQARRESWDDTAFESLTLGHGEIPEQESRAARSDEDPRDAAVRSVYRPLVDRLLDSRGFPIRQELKDRLAERFYWAEQEAIEAAAAEYYGHDHETGPTFRPVEARSLSTLFRRLCGLPGSRLGDTIRRGAMVDRFDQHVAGKSAHEITRQDMRGFADHLRTKGGRKGKPLSPQRINDGYLGPVVGRSLAGLRRWWGPPRHPVRVSAESRWRRGKLADATIGIPAQT